MRQPYTAQTSASIIDFISDPSLLRSSFEGPSWDRHKAVLKAAFADPMTKRDVALFAEVSGGRKLPRHRVKELVEIIGRGGGKDSIAAALAVFIACTADLTHLRPGERGTVMLLATDRNQAAIAYRYVRAHIEETPLLAPLIEHMGVDRILLRNGAEIIVQTNNARSPRGRTIICAIYDEAAHWLGEDYSSPDTEVDAAVTPGLMRFHGSLKIVISSAHRRAGLLYDKFAKHYGRDDDDTLVVLGTSLQFNPTLDAAEIDRQLALDPEKAGAEYLSHWRDDLVNFLDRLLVEAAVAKGVIVRPPQPGVHYVAFVDPSGGRGDSFTAAIGHVEGNLLFVDVVYERRAPFDSDHTIAEVCALVRSYHCHTVKGDDYGADLTVAAFRRHSVTYQSLRVNGDAAKLNRSEIYLNSVGLFTAGRVRLPDNDRLIFQLISLERRAARSGHDSVDHPVGSHDDVANACCGCLVALAAKPASMILPPAALKKLASMAPRQRFDQFGPTAQRGRNRFGRAM